MVQESEHGVDASAGDLRESFPHGDVELGAVKGRVNPMSLLTFSRQFYEADELTDDLKDYLDDHGWYSFVDEDHLEIKKQHATPSFDSHPPSTFSIDEDQYYEYPPYVDSYNNIDYAIHLSVPLREKKRSLSLPDIGRRSPTSIALGEIFCEIAWNLERKLSPRIVHFQSNRDSRRAHLQLSYVDSLFDVQEHVLLSSLDKTVLLEPGELNTREDNHGRGRMLKTLCRNLTDKFSERYPGALSIVPERKIARTLIRIHLPQFNTLYAALEAISECTGILWEWVNRNTIELKAGPNHRDTMYNCRGGVYAK